tara:strand:+ start:2267 stop:3073 length:807 start_codon:yes stop_codon:yes gene_type:complete
MPEGAEVKSFGDSLNLHCKDQFISDITILSGRYSKSKLEGLEDLSSHFPIRVKSVNVRGKFIWFSLDKEFYIYSTLGMTGHWGLKNKKHSRVRISFNDKKDLFYTDIRNFGTLKIIKGEDNLSKKLRTLGPDMLSEDVSDSAFYSRIIKKKNWSLAKTIMNQGVISGVGNYVKAEALWRAKLSPHRIISSLTKREVSLLNRSIKEVLSDSYNNGGATIKSYKTFSGSQGQYSRRFAVYGQDRDPNGLRVIREKTKDGRTTHWVPDIQI